jgi:hypothetical protein
MDNSYWKKRAENLPHYEPAHKTNGTVNDVLNKVPGLPQTVNDNSDGWGKEMDLTSIFSGIVPRTTDQLKAFMGSPQQQRHHQETTPSSEEVSNQQEMVYLKEGKQSYRKLQGAETGSSVSLAINNGPLSGVAGKEFKFVGYESFLIVEGNSASMAIDMSNIDYSKLKKLAIVQAPFVGTYLVPEECIIKANPGRQVLKG